MDAFTKLPENIEVDGIIIPINTDFRASLQFEALINNHELEEREKLIRVLDIYFKLLPKGIDIKNLIEKVLWFYGGGKESKGEERSPSKGRVCDFNQDGNYIVASFLQAYGIDLTSEEMHWWRFLSLVEGLPENTQYSKILGYRTIEITKEMSKEQKKFYSKMKRLYRLKDTRPQWMIDDEFADGFLT